jgi:hypothetical protein
MWVEYILLTFEGLVGAFLFECLKECRRRRRKGSLYSECVCVCVCGGVRDGKKGQEGEGESE